MNKNDGRNLGVFRIALLYLGDVIGAGFASGRETWQYFGIFDGDALKGIAIATFLFAAMGGMTSYLAVRLNTADLGKIILPVRSERITDILGRAAAVIIYVALISMSAAGGSLLHQQLGLPVPVGGALVVFLVIITMLGDFERVSKVFTYVIPVLFIAVAGVCVLVFAEFEPTGAPITTKPAAMVSTWYLSGAVYVAYNIIGTVPINAKSALNARNHKTAFAGTVLGGIGLGALGLVLTLALLRDPAISDSLDLPMLGFADRLSPVVGGIFAVVLFISIYSSATGTYYGFCSKLKNDHRKKYKIIFFAVLGFLIGLGGFRNIVTYVYPVTGYVGIGVMLLTTVNFFRVMIETRKEGR